MVRRAGGVYWRSRACHDRRTTCSTVPPGGRTCYPDGNRISKASVRLAKDYRGLLAEDITVLGQHYPIQPHQVAIGDDQVMEPFGVGLVNLKLPVFEFKVRARVVPLHLVNALA